VGSVHVINTADYIIAWK